MDLQRLACEPLWSSGTPPNPDRSNGNRESDVGLHTDSGCVEERWAPRGSLDDRTRAARAWHSAGRAARETMANVCAGALAGPRRCRLFHNRGVDRARTRHVLHRIPNRVAVQARTGPWLDAISGTKPSSSSACGASVASRTPSYREGGSSSAIAIRSGAKRWSSGSLRPAFVYSERRRARRTATRMRNGLSAR